MVIVGNTCSIALCCPLLEEEVKIDRWDRKRYCRALSSDYHMTTMFVLLLYAALYWRKR